jgi:hypothetical protein
MPPARQGDLFAGHQDGLLGTGEARIRLPLQHQQLLAWRKRLAQHQGPLFAGTVSAADRPQQGQLFATADPVSEAADRFQPLALQPQPLSFWRWPQLQLSGAALYVVLDRPAELDHPLLLYIGETGRADQRWKGEHDCKQYLAAYGETLQGIGVSPRLSISFWSDVPEQTRSRRQLEQALIRRWLPAFNKETRGRWATPFQAEEG